jgi:hypothetical protein
VVLLWRDLPPHLLDDRALGVEEFRRELFDALRAGLPVGEAGRRRRLLRA